MAFAGEEDYGNAYVTLDIDEVNALIALMAMLEQIGVAALADPLIPFTRARPPRPSLDRHWRARQWRYLYRLQSGNRSLTPQAFTAALMMSHS